LQKEGGIALEKASTLWNKTKSYIDEKVGVAMDNMKEKVQDVKVVQEDIVEEKIKEVEKKAKR
jgi:hypothetical protein